MGCRPGIPGRAALVALLAVVAGIDVGIEGAESGSFRHPVTLSPIHHRSRKALAPIFGSGVNRCDGEAVHLPAVEVIFQRMAAQRSHHLAAQASGVPLGPLVFGGLQSKPQMLFQGRSHGPELMDVLIDPHPFLGRGGMDVEFFVHGIFRSDSRPPGEKCRLPP